MIIKKKKLVYNIIIIITILKDIIKIYMMHIQPIKYAGEHRRV